MTYTKIVVLGMTFGSVFFTLACLIFTSPQALAESSDQQLTGPISSFCIHARLEAIDRVSQGLHAEYGPGLEKACGPLN